MFKARDYQSSEIYDIGKYIEFNTDVYDVLNSQLLQQLKTLPVISYYDVNKGYKDIDLISMDVYGDTFLTYYIQYYNDIFEDTFPEGTVLKMFSLSDFMQLCNLLMVGG